MDIAYQSADAAIEKTKQLTEHVKQYQTDNAEHDTGSVVNMEAVNMAEFARVEEPGF